MIWGGGGYAGGYGYGYDSPYPPGYRLDYSVNTPSPQSTSPYNIPLNNGVNISPLDPGYNGNAGAVVTQGVQRSVDGDLVVGVQRELRRRGFYGGAVNGVSDLATRTAIRSYEARAGLPVTGQIGTMLLRSLGFI